MRFTYILIDFFTILLPLLFTFHPRLRFDKVVKYFFPSATTAAVFFITWDIYFTKLGVWGFNKQYTLGIYFINLPLEEVLFFFCIPYSCVFTYHCISIFIGNKVLAIQPGLFTKALIIATLAIGVIYYQRFYTAFTFLVLSLSLFTAAYILKVNWLAKFYTIYAVLLIPFMIVNGLLTGTGLKNPVVWYNSRHIIGLRLLTIPVEDVFYGMGLLLIITIIYMQLADINRKKQHAIHAGANENYNK